MESNLLTAAEASRIFGCHLKTCYRLASERRIPFIRIPGVGLRFPKDKIEAFINAQTIVPKDEKKDK